MATIVALCRRLPNDKYQFVYFLLLYYCHLGSAEAKGEDERGGGGGLTRVWRVSGLVSLDGLL